MLAIIYDICHNTKRMKKDMILTIPWTVKDYAILAKVYSTTPNKVTEVLKELHGKANENKR